MFNFNYSVKIVGVSEILNMLPLIHNSRSCH